MIKIRSAELSDEAEIYSLIAELEEKEFDGSIFARIFRENISSPDIRYFAAEENGRVIGFASVHFQKLLHHASLIAEIQELVVMKEARGRKIGKMLLDRAKAESEKLGCTQMEVCCNKRRISSHAFYESQGLIASHYKFCLPLKTNNA